MLNQHQREEIGAVISSCAVKVRALVTFFSNYKRAATEANRCEATIAAYDFLKRLAAGAALEMTKLQEAIGESFDLPDHELTGEVKLFVVELRCGIELALEDLKLSELPPGKPGEPEFEREFIDKVPLAKPYHRMMEVLNQIERELDSPLYRLDVSDEVREASWRAEKRVQIIAFIDECKAEIGQAQQIITQRNKVMKQAIDDLKNIDQLPLFHSSVSAEDAQQAPESQGPTDPNAVNQSGESDAAGVT